MTAPLNEFGSSILIGGLVTVQFQPKPFDRYLDRIGSILCSSPSQVAIYVGGLYDQCKIATQLFGQNNGFSPQRVIGIPAGQVVYVQWPDAPNTATASAILSARPA